MRLPSLRDPKGCVEQTTCRGLQLGAPPLYKALSGVASGCNEKADFIWRFARRSGFGAYMCGPLAYSRHAVPFVVLLVMSEPILDLIQAGFTVSYFLIKSYEAPCL